MTRAELLDALLNEWRTRPFAYGSSDCCQFLVDAAQRFTGVDYGAAFPAYASLEEAEALIDQHGGLTELISSAFGQPIHPSRAIAGDPVVYVNAIGVEMAGICVGAKVVAPATTTGLLASSMANAIAAWRL